MGYFSGLLRQTGMKIDGDMDKEEHLAENISLKQHLIDGIAPIEIEETVMIEPQEERNPQGPRGIREYESGDGHPIPAESRIVALKSSDRNENHAGIHERASISNVSNYPEIEVQSVIDERLNMEAKRAVAEEMEKGRGWSDPGSPSRINPAKSDRSAMVRGFAAPPDAASNSLEFSDEEMQKKRQYTDLSRSIWRSQKEGVLRFPGEQAYQEQSANRRNAARTPIVGMEIGNLQFGPGSLASGKRKSHDSARINRRSPADNANLNQQILSAVKKEIRDWVAAQSSLTSEQERSRLTEEMIDQAKRALPGALQEMQGSLEAPSMRRSNARGRDDAGIVQQHFHISIGPVHLSVQSAAKGPQRPKTPQQSPGNERSSMNKLQTRLSRHYVILQ
ncbi:MAG: hypothetical protein A4E49_00249 [Methanosaeta sp. PtaU1.Bin112]|nr:MAG: hypothetical protein A4E49_00249 [Methanosaeta sp. PtaU1.Bin112]